MSELGLVDITDVAVRNEPKRAARPPARTASPQPARGASRQPARGASRQPARAATRQPAPRGTTVTPAQPDEPANTALAPALLASLATTATLVGGGLLFRRAKRRR